MPDNATYQFKLSFRLPADAADADQLVDALYEAGCDDALVGLGIKGTIGLEFAREAKSARAAFSSAVADVRKAIPGAELISVQPDLVNLADLAALLGKTRQALQKYAAGRVLSQRADFPIPAIFAPAPAWRLAEVSQWLARNTEIKPPRRLVETAVLAARENVRIQRQRVRELEAA